MVAGKMAKKPRSRKVEKQSSGSTEDLWRSDPDTVRRVLQIRPDYEQLCGEVAYILRKRLATRGVETASITSRAKTLESVLEKVQRKLYTDPLEELTDLAGVRVVCLYGSELEKVAEVIRTEFTVLEDVDKLDELGVDHFGYGARHFVVRLGLNSSGARYDDLKHLPCEVQVRTVVQDAWAIIQHHMVYKRDSQVPTQLQRKLNSLAGLFETVDDQFERIREEREAYVAGVRESVGKPAEFLNNELNLDSLKEYLRWKFPQRAVENWDGQIRVLLDPLLSAGYERLADVNEIVERTADARARLTEELGSFHLETNDGSVASNVEVAYSLELSDPGSELLIPWIPEMAKVICGYKHRRQGGNNGTESD